MKLYITAVAFLISLSTWSQNTYIVVNEIFVPIKKINLLDTLSISSHEKVFTYYDGLGMVKEIVKQAKSPASKDIVQIIEFDGYNRIAKEYLPFVSSKNDGSYVQNAETAQRNFYSGSVPNISTTQFPYSSIKFESSGLGRVVEKSAPGENYTFSSDHTKKFDYSTNSNNEIIKWEISNNELIKRGYYQERTLVKNINVDEDGRKIEEFFNHEGQLLLVREFGNEICDTYYVYNSINLLAYVIMPNADKSTTVFKDYDNTFKYDYDNRRRIIEKRMPGSKTSLKFVYNQNDQVVLEQRNSQVFGDWIFYKYDNHRRNIISGIVNYGYFSRSYLQSLADESDFMSENIVVDHYPDQNNNYYSNKAFPVIDFDNPKNIILTVRYYGMYNVPVNEGNNIVLKPIFANSVLDFSNTESSFTMTKSDFVRGLLTIEFSRCDQSLLPSVYYYDEYQRVIQTRKLNHVNGYDLDFINYFGVISRTLATEHIHYSKNYNRRIKERYDYTYNNSGLVVSRTHTADTLNSNTLNYTYNELSQLIRTNITENGVLLQSTDFVHNIHGAVTKINNPESLIADGDFYGMELIYDEKDNHLNNIPQYTGNISAIKWNTVAPYNVTAFPGNCKAYTYSYDFKSRLTKAMFKEKISGWSYTGKYDERYQYDLNGNIKELIRSGNRFPNNSYGIVDKLNYFYSGQQLIAVDDSIINNNVYDFADNGYFYNTTGVVEMTYDQNGNLKSNLNSQIFNIEYNHLNLPISIEKIDKMKIEYLYDASGNKRRQSVYKDGILIKTTDFTDNCVYEDGKFGWLNFDNGRVIWESKNRVLFEHHLKDHLGNVIVAFSNDGNSTKVQQVNSYYPFGLRINNLSADWVNTSRVSRNEYLFNGKMLQDELGLNWYDYGARFYDPALGRWHRVDPKAEKYPNWSPYSYCFNNPLIFIDPDGQEGIVVSGQPGDHKNEEHFLVNGLDRAKTLQKQYKKEGNGEKATWFVYNSGGEGGYSKETIEKYQKLADKAGITMTVVSDADQIVDYVNDKTGGDSRANDLITNFTYVGHATPGDLDIGFEDHGWNMMTNETLDVSDFNKEAFSKENSNANLVGGCRTAVKGDLPFERSVAEQMADKVSGTVKASSVRVYYPGGVVSDQQLVKKNNGTIVVIQGRNK